jgi:hypothetical protein
MNAAQIISIVVLILVVAAVYLPSLLALKVKPSSMKQVQAVLAIRDSTTSPEVRTACSALLHALLQ